MSKYAVIPSKREDINILIDKDIKSIIIGVKDLSIYPFELDIKEIIKIAQKIDIDKIKVKVNNVKIMKGRNASFVLYLAIEDNEEIKELQRIFFNEFPKEKYNPEEFTFHLTLHIDKDYDKVLELQNTINDNFKPFYLEFDRLALYDYPGDMIKEISFGD